MIKVAAIQAQSEVCLSENDLYNKIFNLAHKAKLSGAKIIVFPEDISLWMQWCKESKRVKNMRYELQSNNVCVQSINRNTIETFVDKIFSKLNLSYMGEWLSQARICNIYKNVFSRVAHELNIVIVGGSIYEKRKNGIVNVSYVFDRDGSVAGESIKTHLVSIEKSWGLIGNTDINPIKTFDYNIGVVICYDLNYTDVVKELSEKGAQLICAPSAGYRPYVGYPFDEIIDNPQIERAKENNISIVRAYQCGWMEYKNILPFLYFEGHSNIVLPDGKIAIKSKNIEEEQILIADVPLK